IVFLTAIAWVFARTLKRSREPLVTRFVRVIEGEDRVNLPGVRGYTRGVTLFWACLLGAMAMLSLALALCAVPGGWLATFGVAAPFALPGSLLAWYPEAGCWIVLLAAFAGEYAFRRWYMRHIPHPSARRFVTQIVQRWPALVPGVVLLERVAAALRTWRGERVQKMDAKFVQSLRADEDALIELHADAARI